MFRNQYDNDVTVWSPHGRLHQVEYAMEAVKLGSATVGVKSKEYAVLIALKRNTSELSAHLDKLIIIDEHIGISIAGLIADARMLSRFMRSECLTHQYLYDAPLPVGRLISAVGNKLQICTQRYDKRPLGIGLLVAGCDDKGPHIYQTCPSANYYDCLAMAIGARSQSARTYLERHLDELSGSDLEQLVGHGLRALRDTLPNDVDLTEKNVSIGIVGINKSFEVVPEEKLKEYLKIFEGDERRRPGPDDDGPSNIPMEGDDKEGGKDKEERDPIPAVAMETD